MDEFESLSHSKWECKYHIVFIPKRRRKTLYGQLKQHLGEVFHRKRTPNTVLTSERWIRRRAGRRFFAR